MKKLFTLTISILMACSLCACGSSTKVTTTTTTTITDSEGNSTSTTTVTTETSYPDGSCGALAADGETHDVNVSFTNNTGEDFTGLYICRSGETEWANLFEEDEVLANGQTAEDYITITYDADYLSYDIGVDDASGELHEFDGIDISDVDENGFTIEFGNSDEGYYWSIDASYVK